MVFYFTLPSAPEMLCYMGKDKYENENLIKWGWPEDVWFHVDDLSSAHVYIRMKPGQTLTDLSPDVIEEAAQLTKANSISGCKLSRVKVVYTLWSNLKKTAAMDVGQVSFKDHKAVRHVMVDKKRELLNKIEKSRQERSPDLEREREERDAEERRQTKEAILQAKEQERLLEEERRRVAELRSYATLQDSDRMRTNAAENAHLEEDFM
eukprot:RCo005639